MPPRSPELLVPSASAWRSWLSTNSSTTSVIWLVIPKTGFASPQLTYQEALDEALCYGWIDSGGCSRDDGTRYLRFGPRKVKSPWSKRNIGFIERLEREGRMAEAGKKAVLQAKANGFWDAAYSAGEPPNDLIQAVECSEMTKNAWEKMPKSQKYAIFVRLGSLPVGGEARQKKIQSIVESLVKDVGADLSKKRSKIKDEAEDERESKKTTVRPTVVAGTRSSRRLAELEILKKKKSKQ